MNSTQHTFRNYFAHRIIASVLIVILVASLAAPLAYGHPSAVERVQDVPHLQSELPRIASSSEHAILNRVPDRDGIEISAAESGNDRWADMQADIRESEYHITWQEHTYLKDQAAAYHAPNRANNLRTYFTLQGITVQPRTNTGDGAPWEFNLSFRDYIYALPVLYRVAPPSILAPEAESGYPGRSH